MDLCETVQSSLSSPFLNTTSADTSTTFKQQQNKTHPLEKLQELQQQLPQLFPQQLLQQQQLIQLLQPHPPKQQSVQLNLVH